jgi:hypothetical protein
LAKIVVEIETQTLQAHLRIHIVLGRVVSVEFDHNPRTARDQLHLDGAATGTGKLLRRRLVARAGRRRADVGRRLRLHAAHHPGDLDPFRIHLAGVEIVEGDLHRGGDLASPHLANRMGNHIRRKAARVGHALDLE